MSRLQPRQKSLYRVGLFFVLLVAVCAGVSYLTVSWVLHMKDWRHNEAGGHAWLAQELALNAEETARIDAFEADYRLRRRELEAEFHARINTLARIIRENDAYTEEVTHAVHELHGVHSALQQLSIEHYYEMLSVLPPEKQDRLRSLAVEALSQPE